MPPLGNSEASAPQRFKCISIMGSSNRAMQLSTLGKGVLSRDGPFLEVPLGGWAKQDIETWKQISKMEKNWEGS